MVTAEEAGLVGLVGFAVWQLHEAYTDMAPDLHALRECDPFDLRPRQQLMDTDVCVGGIALLAGGAASWLMRSPLPLALMALAFVLVSGYHHAVLNG